MCSSLFKISLFFTSFGSAALVMLKYGVRPLEVVTNPQAFV